MKKIISFGKIDYYGNGRKMNPVDVEINLKETERGFVFTASGHVWNHIKTDCYTCGQCLDTIAEYVHDDLFEEIYRIWKLYHLNDMHAGTIEQEKAIDEWKAQGNRYDYAAVCDYLKSIGLYEVEYNGEPYKYGHAWLYWEIPADDLAKIKALFD